MSLVRSHRSNPALKQALGKARFLRKIFFDCGIKSAAVYAAKAKKSQLSGRQWGVYFLQNLWRPKWERREDLAFSKGCQEICDR